MLFLNRVRDGLRSRETELVVKTKAFLLLYVCTFTTLQAPANNNVYCNAIAVVFMLLAGLWCLLDRSRIINLFSISFAAFTAYVFLSILWSPVRAETWTTAITLIRLLIMGTLMYNFLATNHKKEYILIAFVLAGIVVTFTTVFYYGPKAYFGYLFSGYRIGGELYAINYVAYILIISSLISFWRVLFRRNWVHILPGLICLFASVGTGSRASILAFCVGILVLAFFRSKGIWRVITPIIIVGFLFFGYKALELPVFGSLHSRLASFLQIFESDGITDSSTAVRIDMVKWGFEQFKQTPIFGIGFSAGSTVMAKYGCGLGLFHNTYMEMLVGGGIVGLCLYYFMFVYPFVKLIKPAFSGEDTAIIAIVLLVTYLVLFLFGSEYFEQATPVVICYLFLTVADFRKKTSSCGAEPKQL